MHAGWVAVGEAEASVGRSYLGLTGEHRVLGVKQKHKVQPASDTLRFEYWQTGAGVVSLGPRIGLSIGRMEPRV